jgi:hypothetical protein
VKKIRCPRCGAECASERWASAHCKPSRKASRTGYRRDSARHKEARKKVPPKLRKKIAKMGAAARLRKKKKPEAE